MPQDEEIAVSPEVNPDLAPSELEPETAQPAEQEVKAEDQPEPERRHQGGFQKRIGKLTARLYEKDARIAELERANGNHNAPQAHQQQPPPENEDQQSESAEQLQERIHREARAPLVHRYTSRLQVAMDEAGITAEQARKVNVPNAIVPVLLELENGPEISIHLARHPEDCQLLMNMSGHQAVAYIGRIAERLERSSESRPVSRAAAPVKPVGNSSTHSSLSLEDLPQAEYNRIRNEQERRRHYR